jgi:hypothetical protein
MMAPLLLVLVSLVLPLETSQLIHLHDADTGGLYNEEHVFTSLDSLLGDLPLPGAGSATFVPFVSRAYPLTGRARPSAPAQNLADSRAPPLA